MAIDFNSIKDSSNEDLFSLTKLLDPKLKEIEFDYYKIYKGHGVRGFLKPDLMYWVDVFYQGGYYETPPFKIVVRELVKLPPAYVASKLKTEYSGNVLMVNRWEPQLTRGEIEKYFRKENVSLLWWGDLI